MTGWQDSFQPVQSQPQGWQTSFQSASQGPAAAIANSGVGQMVNSGITNAADVMGDVINPFIGGKYKDQVQTPDLDALKQGGWSGTPWPQKLGAVEEALMTSPPGKILGMLGASPQGALIGAGFNTANQAAESNLGIPHQVSQGVEAVAAPFLGKSINNGFDQATNLVQSIPQSIPQTMANNAKGIGGIISNNQSGIMPRTVLTGFAVPQAVQGPKIPISPDIQSTLLNGSPDVRTYLGEDLGQKLSGAEQNAYTNKTLAYKAAEQPSKDLNIGNNSVGDLADALKDSTANFNPRVVNNVGGIHDAADALTKDAASGDVSWQRIDQVRQELYNLPKANDAEAAVRARALSAYHNYADDVFNNGIVQGDPTAINLVKDANQANATWRQQFTGKDANNAISKYIKNAGGPEEIAPENLLDMFTRVGQIGLDNVKAAKDVLGTDASPILKQGYLDKLRSTSLDQNGEFVPAKLQTNINTLLTKNPTLVNSVFTPEELQGLQGISDTAGRYAKTGAKPGVLGRVTLKIPIAKQLFGPSIEAAAKTRMMNDIATPRAQ